MIANGNKVIQNYCVSGEDHGMIVMLQSLFTCIHSERSWNLFSYFSSSAGHLTFFYICITTKMDDTSKCKLIKVNTLSSLFNITHNFWIHMTIFFFFTLLIVQWFKRITVASMHIQILSFFFFVFFFSLPCQKHSKQLLLQVLDS